MPRVNNTEYHNRRAALKSDWDQGGTIIRRLTADQQWRLHDYYLFTRTLDSGELDMARAAAVEADPELTVRAGLAYRSFAKLRGPEREDLPEEPIGPLRLARKKTRVPGSHREVRVFSELNHGIDASRLAEILVRAAREQARKKANS